MSFLCNLGGYYHEEVGPCCAGGRQRNPLSHTETTAIAEAISSSSDCWEIQHLGPFDSIVGLNFHGNYQVTRSTGMSKFFNHHYFKGSSFLPCPHSHGGFYGN